MENWTTTDKRESENSKLFLVEVHSSGVVQEALIVRENLPGWNMKTELQCNQNSKLGRKELLPTDSKTILNFLK